MVIIFPDMASIDAAILEKYATGTPRPPQMQIHLILALNGPESANTLGANIARVYPNRSRPLRNGSAWLVADDSTANTVSTKLGITTGQEGISALVTTMADYFGRAEPDLWSWIKVQWEAPPDGNERPADAA